MLKLLMLFTLFMSTSIFASSVPKECDPCDLGQGYCVDGKPKLTCLVNSLKKCPRNTKAKNAGLYVMTKIPSDATCSCKDTGATEVTCIMR